AVQRSILSPGGYQGERISVPHMRAEMGSPWSVSFFDTLQSLLFQGHAPQAGGGALHLGGPAEDGLRLFPLGGGQVLLGQQFGAGQDDRQWGLELVGQGAEQGIPAAVGLPLGGQAGGKLFPQGLHGGQGLLVLPHPRPAEGLPFQLPAATWAAARDSSWA